MRIDPSALRARLAALWARAEGLPLVSLGLAALLLLAFLVIQIGFGGRLQAGTTDVRAAVDYGLNHPAVEIHPRLLRAVRSLMPQFESNEAFAFLRETSTGARVAREQQQEYDELASSGLALLDGHPYRVLGLVPAKPRWPSVPGYVFAHVGWIHVLGTLVLLLALGPLLERTWGPGPLGGVLLLAALLGAGSYAGIYWGADRPLVGASPLVAALAAAATVRFRMREVDPLGWVPADVSLRLPFWALTAAWAAYEVLLLLWAMPGAMPGGLDAAPALAANAAGALVGGLAGFGLERLGIEERFGSGAPLLESRRAVQRFDFERVKKLRAKGEADKAYALLRAEVERSSRNRNAVVTFFEMSVERGVGEKAASVMCGLIAEELRRGALDMGVSHWRALIEAVPDAPVDPALLLRLFPEIRKEDGDSVALFALRKAFEGDASKNLAGRIAHLASDLDATLAAEAARLALASEALAPAERKTLEALVGKVPQLEPEPPPPVVPKPEELPKNVFYEEQDRSMFDQVGGEFGELTRPGDEDLLTPTPAPTPDPLSFAADPDLEPATQPLLEPEVTEAVPLDLGAEALSVEIRGRGQVRVPWTHVHAVAVAGVHGIARRPVVLIDLLVTGPRPHGHPRRVVRLRSDTFDPRPFAPAAETPLAALRAFASELARSADAPSLPEKAEGDAPRLRTYESLDEYHREVLSPHL